MPNPKRHVRKTRKYKIRLPFFVTLSIFIKNPITWVLLTSFLITISYLGFDLDYVSFLGKTVWEWIEIIVGVSIPVLIFWASSRLQKSLKEKDEDRFRQEVLKTYIDQMTQLILHEYWPRGKRTLSPETAQIVGQDKLKAVARAKTLAVLRELDGVRKGEIVRFLSESNVLKDVSLIGADLSNANLRNVDFSGQDLRDVDFRHADLSFCNLSGSNLRNSDFESAKFFGAGAADADFYDVNLKDIIWNNDSIMYGKNLEFASNVPKDFTPYGVKFPYGSKSKEVREAEEREKTEEEW
jgi:hypothetical protein